MPINSYSIYKDFLRSENTWYQTVSEAYWQNKDLQTNLKNKTFRSVHWNPHKCCASHVSNKFSWGLMVRFCFCTVWDTERWRKGGWKRPRRTHCRAPGCCPAGGSQDFRVRSPAGAPQTHKYTGFNLQSFNEAWNLKQIWVKIINFHLGCYYYYL